MKAALISDIHSNFPALEAVFEEIAQGDVDEVWCLGDIVGYGPHPNECAEAVAERCDLTLLGNHDLAVTGDLDISSFSPAAAEAVNWTRTNMSADNLDFLRSLEPSAEHGGVGLYHASPRDPIWEYVLWPDQAAECLEAQSCRISFVGHSHVALFFVVPEKGGDTSDLPALAREAGPDRKAVAEPDFSTEDATAGGSGELDAPLEARGAQSGADTKLDLSEGRWLINPGSVGQPRDGDPRAAWLELDTEAWSATYRRTTYDIDLTAAAIADSELPDHLGRRLYLGQ